MKPKNKSKENMPDTDHKPRTFEEMMTGVDKKIECEQAEESIVDRILELRRLNVDIEKATTLLTNALLALEDSIRRYKHEEIVLNGSVITIRKDIESIDNSIAKLIEEAPNKLKVSVKLRDADRQEIIEMFDRHRRETKAMMQKHIQEVNTMLTEERRKVQRRYKEYDGCYLGHYIQWFFWFFFTIGLSLSGIAIFMAIS